MLAALDSNIILYAEGVNDEERRDLAQSLIVTLGPDRIVLPLQAIGELAFVLVRVVRRDAAYAAERARDWRDRHKVQETTTDVFDGALEIVKNHGLRIWDAIILSAASVAGARVLLSENMESGFRWQNVTIINPFILNPSELLAFMALAAHQKEL